METTNQFEFEVTNVSAAQEEPKKKMRQARQRYDSVDWSDISAVRTAGGGTSNHAATIFKGDLLKYAPGLLARIVLSVSKEEWESNPILKGCIALMLDQHYFLYDRTELVINAVRECVDSNLSHAEIEGEVFQRFAGRKGPKSKVNVTKMLALELKIDEKQAQALIDKARQEPESEETTTTTTTTAPAVESEPVEVVARPTKKSKK